MDLAANPPLFTNPPGCPAEGNLPEAPGSLLSPPEEECGRRSVLTHVTPEQAMLGSHSSDEAWRKRAANSLGRRQLGSSAANRPFSPCSTLFHTLLPLSPILGPSGNHLRLSLVLRGALGTFSWLWVWRERPGRHGWGLA